MLGLGPHGHFIVAAYAIVVIVLAGLSLWIVANERRLRRLLAELEERGVTRRSSATPPRKRTKRSGP